MHSNVAHIEAPDGASLLPGYEWFGKWQTPIQAKWVLDFALDGWRSVQVGTKRQIQASFKDWFSPVLVTVETRKGPQQKINPTSGFLLLGYGPLIPGPDEHDALQRYRKSKRKGGWYEGELERVTLMRKALALHKDYQANGGLYLFDEWVAFEAPKHWFDKLQLDEEKLCLLV